MTQTETRIFHYDLKGHLIAETNQTGQMLAEYVYLGDQLLSMIKPGELVYYFHNDHLGTPQILTNDSQAISWKAVYTPFGEAVASITTVENPIRFPGQYCDTETGLHYNYFRYYNPQTGRYITPDPIGLEGGINLFAYVTNNPVNSVDRDGLRKVILPLYRIAPNGQLVPIVHDTETGRNTFGFPENYIDPLTQFTLDALSTAATFVDKVFDNPCSNEATKAAPMLPITDWSTFSYDAYALAQGFYKEFLQSHVRSLIKK